MATIENFHLSSKEQRQSPVEKIRKNTQSRVSNVLERGKEAVKNGFKEAFRFAGWLGVFTGTANLILGNPAPFVASVLHSMAFGAAGGFGVGTVESLIRTRKKK